MDDTDRHEPSRRSADRRSADTGSADTGGRRVRRTSVATRLAVSILVVSIASITLTVVFSTMSVENSADSLRENRTRYRATMVSDELTAYLRRADSGIRLLATSPSVAESLQAFSSAFDELTGLGAAAVREQGQRLGEFYLEEFLPMLAEVRGAQVDPLDFSGRQGDAASVYLQTAYIADNPFADVDRRLLSDAGDGSTWSTIHAQTHPALRAQVERLGFTDLFLIDLDEDIVYSTNKDVAFATNLADGPQSDTSLAGLVRDVAADRTPGVVAHADFSVYPPALDTPTAFLAAPVYDSADRFAGVLAASISTESLTGIVSRGWREGRLGATGDVYLVGADKTMRSDSRFFIEDQRGYLAQIEDLGTVPDQDINRMRTLGTTVVFQPVDNAAVRSGLDGDTGIATVTNYLGDEVSASYSRVGGDAFDWVLIAEQQVSEANAAFDDYIRRVLVVTVVFVVALTFAAVAWSSRFTAPLRTMSAALANARKEREPQSVPLIGVREFRELADRLNRMTASLVRQQDAVVGALRAKAAILRTILPSTAARLVSRGERRMAEPVPHASVVVVVMEGMDDVFASGDIEANRMLLHGIVDRLDALTRRHGLERVKVVGDSYVAMSAAKASNLDYTPRALAFAEDAISEIMDLAIEADASVVGAAGVATGSITEGLIGDSRLVFDIWGVAVDESLTLARAATPGHILVTQETKERLPGDTPATERDIPGVGAAWDIAASVHDAEATA